VVVAAALILPGCASVQQIPMNPSSAETLKHKEIALSERAKPDFAATTPSRGAFGMIGAGVTISEGNKLIREHGIEDPALYIGKALAWDLQDRYHTRLSPKGAPTASDEVDEVVKNANGADLVLDVRTLNWSFVYYPTSWGKYRVIYSARLRLVDVKNGTVLAEGGCARVPAQSDGAPSYGELIANSAARLKQELRIAAEHCISEFKSKTLAVSLQQAH
jgi:hypothetical protein